MGTDRKGIKETRASGTTSLKLVLSAAGMNKFSQSAGLSCSMVSCCASDLEEKESAECPACGHSGQQVKTLTLKALLRPSALETLDPEVTHQFCPSATCEVVYFADTAVYRTSDLKVRVYPKDASPDAPLCFCFDHTRAKVLQAAQVDLGEALQASIRQHIRAGRCGCEVNNPQGRCCLGNIILALQTHERELNR